MTQVRNQVRPPLLWTEALRALVCLVPMLVATAIDRTTYLVTLGQGAFFFSSLFLPETTGRTLRDGVPGSGPRAGVLSDWRGGGAVPVGSGDLHLLRLPEPQLHDLLEGRRTARR